MNRQPFYDYVTRHLFKGSLPNWQQAPLDGMWDEALRRGRTLYECAYVMATAYHETARFKYSEEIGRGEGRKYGEPAWLYSNKRVTFFGRSWPQHTWLGNYAKLSIRASMEFGREINFVANPDLINTDPAMEAWAMWEGMASGMWTGNNLADYRTDDGKLDYVEARRIVNGTDKAELIAGYAEHFEAALLLSDGTETPPEEEKTKCPLRLQQCPNHRK